MKYKGKKLEGRNTDILVLMKGQDRIVFKAEAISDYKEFDKLCSTPEPPERLLPGGIKEKNKRDPTFLKKAQEFAELKSSYTVVKSLEKSEDIEWDTVDLEKPETWKNWRTELEEAGFTEIEIGRVIVLISQVNCLDDDLLLQAKEDFLAEAPQQEQ